MPLGTRELGLVIRARDQASQVIGAIAAAFVTSGRSMDAATRASQAHAAQSMRTGAALGAVGVVMLATGVAVAKAYAGMAKDSIEYNKQASLTLTQVRETGVGLEQVADIGKRVASQIAVPFKSIQEALYDIFSSTDLTAKEAEKALASFAKGAVAGSVSVLQASDAGISVLNGFKLGVDQLTRVMDVQFKTVQVGRITYDELSRTIGRAIPSAARAGASIEELGGALAFATRNGLSAAMAATGVARAFDLMSNPIFVSNMRNYGVAVTDAQGNFRSFADVMTDLRTKMSGLSEEARSNKLKELTYGAGGTIQAMRILNLAVTDSNGLLNQLTGQVTNSAGSMEAAYKIMADTPAAKLLLLKNNWQILRTEIGDRVIPILNKVVEVALALIQAWNGLPDILKTVFSYGSMLAAALLILVGTAVALAGAIMFVGGAAEYLALPIGALVAAFGWFVAIAAAVVVAGVLIYKNWDTLKAKAQDVWGYIGDKAEVVGKQVTSAYHWIQETVWSLTDTFNMFKSAFMSGFNDPLAGFEKGKVYSSFLLLSSSGDKATRSVADLTASFDHLNKHFVDAGAYASYLYFRIKNELTYAFDAFKSVAISVWTIVSAQLQLAWTIIGPILHIFWSFITELLIPAIKLYAKIWVEVFGIVWDILKIVWGFIEPVLKFVVIGIGHIIDIVQILAQIFVVQFNVIVAIVRFVWSVISVIFQMIAGILIAVLGPQVRMLADAFDIAFKAIATVVGWAWKYAIQPVLEILKEYIRTVVMPIIDDLKKRWSGFWDGATDVVNSAWGGIHAGIKWGVNGAVDLMNGFLRKSGDVVNAVVDTYNKLPGAPHVDRITVPQIPRMHTGGLVTNAGAVGSGEVLRILQTGEGVLNRRAMANVGPAGLNAMNSGRGSGLTIASGAVQIIVQGGVDSSTMDAIEEKVYSALSNLYNEVRAS